MSTVEPTEETESAEMDDPSTTGLDSNLAGALTYLLGFVTGLVFLVVEREDASVRWHAAQSTAVFGGLLALNVGLTVVGVVFGLALDGVLGGLVGLVLSLVGLALGLASLVAWVGLMVTAYQGRTVRVPVFAGVADRIVGSSSARIAG
ncbi:MAG: hypothetical protein V5A31_04900 [Haloferacaceae archaeon]|jgi:uncharacterized membrane protein